MARLAIVLVVVLAGLVVPWRSAPTRVAASPRFLAVAEQNAGAPADDPRVYRPPVDATVTDPFRPPPEPWNAGNRGLEYETVPGTSVGAIGSGVVAFAGPVAGALYVTVLHPDGLRSSYSYLASITVSVGDRLAGGDATGVSGAMMHLGVRDGDTYIDPASLWGQRVTGGSVFLVPLGGLAVPSPGGAESSPRSSGGHSGSERSPGSPGERMGAGVSVVGRDLAQATRALGVVVTPSLHSSLGPPPPVDHIHTSARVHPRSSNRFRFGVSDPGFA